MAAIAGTVLVCVGHAAGESTRVKLIQAGWDLPSTGFMRAHWAEMERMTPFDGVVFKLEASADGGAKVSTLSAWDATPWKREWFQTARDDLAECHPKVLASNFVWFNATPGNLDWGDDAGWEALTGKAAICAWLLRESGQKGSVLDFESYGQRQFEFDARRGRNFPDTVALARRRGAEFVRAIAAEYPNATILAFWLNSVNHAAGRSGAPEAVLMSEAYGLLPAFINGMLDALPPEMTLIDGCENGYYMDGELEYQRAATDIRSLHGPSAALVSPENLRKWRGQTQVGFGFYLDMYLNPEGNHYYRGPKPGGTRLDRLAGNLAGAVAAADEYVWVYGEQCRWWDVDLGSGVANTVGKGRYWEEAMPGLTDVIRWSRDADAAARLELERRLAAGTAENLAQNGDFTRKAENADLPAEWGTWQNDDSTGTFAHDPDIGGGSARATKVKRGCFIQSVPAKEGEVYWVEAEARIRGASAATIRIRWQTADGAWIQENADRTIAFSPGANEWTKASGAATVPSGAGRLVILLNALHQETDDDVCWFDNAKLYRVRDARPTPPSPEGER
jgi:hypothetical protein